LAQKSGCENKKSERRISFDQIGLRSRADWVGASPFRA